MERIRGARLPAASEVTVQVLRVSSADGTSLRVVRWGEGKRDVLLVHGLAEHAGRYAHVAEALGAAGYRVSFVELRGHGESAGDRGHTSSWRRYAEDLWAAARTLDDSYAIVAHSMGGLVALDAVREAMGQPVLGLALSNPMIGLAFDPPRVKVRASRVLSKLAPRLKFRNEMDTSKISRDPEVVRRYEADTLVFDTITPRWFVESVEAMKRVKAAASRMTLPMMMMVGESDAICSPREMLALATSWGGPRTICRYPALYHELFNEPEKGEVFADLTRWLDTLRWED